MKTVFDLSRDEIVALTDEEISLYIDKELVGKGIPIEAKNWNIKNEKEVVYPDCGVPIFVIKDIGVGFRKIEDATEVVNLLVRSRAFKVGSKYLNRSYERLNVINEGVVPAVEGCVGYTNEEFERVNKENNDPESEKIGSFNKTVEEANNIRSRVLKYVDKIKQERAYNIDLCMTFERYIEIEFVYESKDCAGPYNSLFVRKDGYGISSIYANTEGCTIGGTTLELKVEAGAYFKKGDVLTSTNGYQFIYDGIITKGIMGCICGIATFGDIRFDYKLWTHVYDEDKKTACKKAIEEEKKFLAEKIIKVEDSRKIDIIKRYLSEYEYLLDEMPKRDFKPFERVLVRRTNQERWKLHLFSRESGEDNKYECLGGVGFSQCIPYEGNEHLLGTNKNK